MLIEVKVPQLSESVAEATLVSWHKQVGEAVARDENLIDIETDKVVLETPAPDAGVLVAIIKQNGALVTSGELIAQIDTEGKAAAVAPAAAAAPAAAPAAAAVVASASASSSAPASPAARKIMDERGLAGGDVQGTGRGGRITKPDAVGAAVPAAAA
ncbi:MAG: biotin/lipoyl-containing protein, partial [Pseudomonadota bacterium]